MKTLLEYLYDYNPVICKRFTEILCDIYSSPKRSELLLDHYRDNDFVEFSLSAIFLWTRANAVYNEHIDWDHHNDQFRSYIRNLLRDSPVLRKQLPLTESGTTVPGGTYKELLAYAYPFYIEHFLE